MLLKYYYVSLHLISFKHKNAIILKVHHLCTFKNQQICFKGWLCGMNGDLLHYAFNVSPYRLVLGVIQSNVWL